ncbi:MAG: acyloxyacyl hydrolase [Pseudomonadota bacterium]|nr:acyloxyacyl hydrolase [Pseudomonadota bacterium]
MRPAWIAAAFFVAATAPAAAQIDEVRVGLLIHDTGPFSTGKEDGVDFNGEVIFNSPSGLSWLGAPRPFVGLAIAANDDATSQLYGGLGWRLRLSPQVFAGAGVGLVIHDGETDFDPADPFLPDTAYLGCRVLGRLSGEVGYRLGGGLSASVEFAHASNAGICDENEGIDTVGFRLGYKF